MFGTIKKKYRGDGVGMSWPNSPSSSGIIKDSFGPRTFLPHVPTIGYNYDFHRGIDIYAALGAPIFANTNGAISRLHYTHFGWQNSLQLLQWSLTDPSSSLTYALASNSLGLTASRNGVADFPNGVSMFKSVYEKIAPQGDDWVLEMNISSTLNLTGSVGIGVFNSDYTQYFALEYDGSTFTMRGKDASGSFTNNGVTSSVANKTWLRLQHTKSTDTFTWEHSFSTGSLFTKIASESNKQFTFSGSAILTPTVYWRSTDTNATSNKININYVNWCDLSQSISRYGNWLQIASPIYKTFIFHFDTLIVSQGQFVSVGDLLGYAGATGFDARSGRVQYEHIHAEYAPNNGYLYSNDAQQNILDANLLPRVNVSNNVSASTALANDPDGKNSHRLTLTVTRADSDFDLNQITLTGNSAARTVNWNTRSGLATDNDVPKNSGVYIVPSSFDENSATYNISVYFNTSSVGATLVSYSVKDTQGNTLVSG